MTTLLRRVAPRTPLLARGVLSLCSLLCFTALVLAPSLHAQLSGVSDAQATQPGTIEGTLVIRDSNRPAVGVTVTIRESGASVTTDERGRYRFDSVIPGTYTIVAAGETWGRTRITDVVVQPGSDLTLSRQGIVSRGTNYEPIELEEYVVSARKQGVVELDPYEVSGRKERPFTNNMDIPRTENDVQPYHIYDTSMIQQSGAQNIERFIRNFVTMNAKDVLNSQLASSVNTGEPRGNTSEIDLRGLGADKTLILVNGRRVAGVVIGENEYQPDINGIPLAAVDRIEILPSSASGIYGGSAIGGVVNIVLKKDFSGGEILARYETTLKTDAPKREVSITYGRGLNGGRTRLMVNASAADSKPALFGDYMSLAKESVAEIQRNAPEYLFASFTPWRGNLPNIRSEVPLVLDDGRPLGSNITYVSAGTSPTVAPATLFQSLISNAGQWNLDFPDTTQEPTGLRRPLGLQTKTTSVRASLNHRFSDNLEVFGDVFVSENRSHGSFNPSNLFAAYFIAADSPTNPFTSDISVNFPVTGDLPQTHLSSVKSASIGAHWTMPFEWVGEADFSASRSGFESRHERLDFTYSDAIYSGQINILYDTLQFGVPFREYLVPYVFKGENRLYDASVRAAGPLPELAKIQSQLALGAQHRVQRTPERTATTQWPMFTELSETTTYYARSSATTAGYGELNVDLIEGDSRPLLHALSFQAAGRVEQFRVDTGTPYETLQWGMTPPQLSYGSPTANGLPFQEKSTYTASNYTVGAKYNATPELIFRASRATAFLPPKPAELTTNAAPVTSNVRIFDRQRNNARYFIQTFNPGNPDLKPQHSISDNVGIILLRERGLLAGIRLNVEWWRIEQFDAIATFTAQILIDNENAFPERIERGTSGLITRVNTSPLNLLKRKSEGVDLRVEYKRDIAGGQISMRGAVSKMHSLINQYAVSAPALDYVNAPGEGGALKWKGAAGIVWEKGAWTIGWNMTYFGKHLVYGGTGGPLSQRSNGGVAPGYDDIVDAQGGDTVQSQSYHDLFVAYRTGVRKKGPRLISALLERSTLTLGMTNITGRVPPLDAGRSNETYFRSPYGPFEGRAVNVSIRKEF